jgi:hypothetical protein
MKQRDACVLKNFSSERIKTATNFGVNVDCIWVKKMQHRLTLIYIVE